MCGIAGFQGAFSPSILGRMNSVLAHRGPDDSDTLYVERDAIGLAHRRLSIIDLSPLGRQPMADVTDSVVIVFNGEIYNYLELRKALVADGFGFRSNTDTEVLLNLYLRDGVDMLRHLNGMFAFALYDRRDGSLFVARDGVGVKPLYFATTSLGFVFASELKALFCEPSLPRELDHETLIQHLTFLWSAAPKTMLKGVQKLPPGTALLVRRGQVERQWVHYDLPFDEPIHDITAREAAESLREHLETAVRRQLVADVPVGAFLSGGLDSSAVVATMRKLDPSRVIDCFTIRFDDPAADDEGFAQDLGYARRVASHLGTNLHEIQVGAEMANQLESMVVQLDEPQADFAPLHTRYICELARASGIKVLLSGTGGDDIFTGYRRHSALRLEQYWKHLPRPLRAGCKSLSEKLPLTLESTRRLRKAFQYADRTEAERLVSYFYWQPPNSLAGLLNRDLREMNAAYKPEADLHRSLAKLPANTAPINKMLYLEGKHFLADHNLNYTDKMSMAASTEVRVPLLDPDLMRFAVGLPPSLKQRGVWNKWIFRKSMEGLLPNDVIYRPKTGFGVPLRHWINHQLAPMLDDILSSSALSKSAIFDAGAVSRLRSATSAGRADGAYLLISIACVEIWMRNYLPSK